MKNIMYLSIMLMGLFACGGDSSTPASNVQSIDLTGFQITELPDGYQHVIRSNTAGKILEEGMIKNGKRNGTWVTYHDRRPLPRSIANFVNDEYSGVYMEYSTTGQIDLICRYKSNKLNGKYNKIKNTRILEEGTYVNGEIDGSYKKYYANKEIVQQEVNYKMGKLHGPSKYYSEEGQLLMEYEYKDGEKISGGMVKEEQPSKE